MDRSTELVNCLRATLSPETHIRHHAESCIQEWSLQKGFCLRLIGIVQSNDPTAQDVQQLAAVVLRRHIQKYWVGDDVMIQGFSISDAEKAQVRLLLPSSLAEPTSRIQTAVSMAIAEIGRHDCPNAWPELLPGLITSISDKNNHHLVAGAVRCLALLVEDLSDEQVVEVAPVVLPDLIDLVQQNSVPMYLRRWCLIIFKYCLNSFELQYKQSAKASAVLHAILTPWLNAITQIMSLPTSEDAPEVWGLQFEALGCLTRVVRSFTKVALPTLPPTLSACWTMFSGCAPLYDRLVIRNEGDESGVEEDIALDKVSFSTLISQLFELLLTLIGNSRVRAMLQHAFPQLAYVCIGYMQPSDESVEKWSADINEFLSNEDDFWGVRASGELLIDELIESGGRAGLSSVAEAIQKRSDEAFAARQAGSDQWWRQREAALLATGATADKILGMKFKNKPVPTPLDPEIVSQALLQGELSPHQTGLIAPIVVGRALWLFYKWAPALSQTTKTAGLAITASALAPGTPVLVQAGAYQSFARLCKNAKPEDLQPISEQAFAALSHALPRAEEDSLHLVIETLTALVKASALQAAQWSQHIIPCALKVWVDHVTDPLLGEDSEKLIRALAGTPNCLPALQSYAVPTLCQVVSNPTGHPTSLVAGCLDLLTLVLQPSTAEGAAAIAAAALPPVLALMQNPVDEDIAASGISFLRTTLQVGGAASLVWHSNSSPQAAALGLIDIAHYVLKPEHTGAWDIACRPLGGFICEIFRHTSTLVASDVMASLVLSTALKLPVVEDPMAVQSLITVLAFIVTQSDASQFVELLLSNSINGLSPSHALQGAMSKWTERHIEIRTPYDINLSISALARLLVCPHPALDSITVKGRRIDVNTGIRTRARRQSEQWSEVPLRVKIFALLSDSYIEAVAQQQKLSDERGQDGSSTVNYQKVGPGIDWEEDEFSDDDDDDDDEGDGDDVIDGGDDVWDEYGMYMGGDDGGDDVFGDGIFEELTNVDPLEQRRREQDALSSLDIASFVGNIFKELAQTSPHLVHAAAAELTPTQVQSVQRIWQ